MKKNLSFLLLTILLLSLFSIVFASQIRVNASSTESWTTFMNNYQRTGTSSNTGPETNATVWKWYQGLSTITSTRDPTESVALTPAVVNGVVYVGTDNNSVVALNEFTGAIIWESYTGDYVRTPPTVADGKVFVGSWDGYMYALDATNGKLIWKHGPIDLNEGLSSGLWTMSPIVTQGLVVFGAQQIYALNETNGNLVWNTTMSEGQSQSFGIALSGNEIITGSLDDNVYALNLTTGNIIWTYPTGAYIEAVPSIAYGDVFVGSTDNYTYCLNLQTGQLVWKTEFGWSNSMGFGGGGWNHAGIADGMIFTAGTDGMRYAFNATNGDLIWTFQTGNASWTGTDIAGGVAYFGSWDGKIYAVNEYTGKELWDFQVNGTMNGDPAIVDGMLIWGSSETGYLYALGAPVNQPSTSPSPTEMYVIAIAAVIIIVVAIVAVVLRRRRTPSKSPTTTATK